MPDSKRILQFWRNIEIFHLPDLKESKYLDPDELFPWQIEREVEDGKEWRYTLLIGKALKKQVIEKLRIFLGDHSELKWIEPPTGETCLTAILLDSDGRPYWNSYMPASFIYGIHCLKKKKPLKDVKEMLSLAGKDFQKRFNFPNPLSVDIPKGDIVTSSIILREINELQNIIGSKANFEYDVYYTDAKVPIESEPRGAFLNSFFLDDLDFLLDNNAPIGPALQQYLTPSVVGESRLDLIKNKYALLNCLNPKWLPSGKWPSNIKNGLYTAQQGAVNVILNDLREGGGIRGINGPPGTGKTTLLLDVIADVIVSRAERLIQLNVDDIFTIGSEQIITETGFKYNYHHFKNRDYFAAYGIVVSSNNNTAVENISKELPSIDKIDSETFKDADYFRECATKLLDDKEAWGILSAPLGNSKNKSEFKKKFWEYEKKSGRPAEEKEIFPSFSELLRDLKIDKHKNENNYRDEFEKTKSELTTLINIFESFQKKATQLHEFTLGSDNNPRVLKFVSKNAQDKKNDKILSELKESFGIIKEHIVDQDFLQSDYSTIQLGMPYSSPELNKLRGQIFLKSLALHKCAILANANSFYNNLRLFFEIIKGKLLVSEEIGSLLWDNFFFCVPVVSTSLASVSRLFKNIGKESIGWFLLDEAGQATPQSIAGMLWRSKRCIAVGDPLQIPPVVNDPDQLIKILRDISKIDDVVWSPLASSAQTLVDRVSLRGTYFGDGDQKIWSGFPLRAHRRCDNPMFDIANQIAYEGRMVKAKKDELFKCMFKKSFWFDIEGVSVENKHVITEEITFLKNKIDELKQSGYHKDIFVISPFVSIRDACLEAFDKKFYSNIKCGTVHTFQGKEAEIVFLILGTDPKQKGPRSWVTETPNLLNVAVTRAKNRFFIIGNVKLWGYLDFLNVFKKSLTIVKAKRESHD